MALTKSASETAFKSEMGRLRAERDAALGEVNKIHAQRVRESLDKASKARHDIWIEYDNQRNKLVLNHADAEEENAA